MASTTKLMILAAAMAALVVLANARRYQTTAIMTNDARPNEKGQCSREMLGFNWPVNCERYLMDRIVRSHRRGGGYYGGREEEMIITPNQERGLELQCCEDLKRMQESTSGCMCEAMEAMVERMKEMPGQRMSESLMDETLSLPMMCGTEQRKCPMPSTYLS